MPRHASSDIMIITELVTTDLYIQISAGNAYNHIITNVHDDTRNFHEYSFSACDVI